MNKKRFGYLSIVVVAFIALSSCREGGNSTPPVTPLPDIQVTDSTPPVNDYQLTFGNIWQGDSSDQTVTITNTGTADLVFGNLASANPLADPFDITADTCSGETIAPSGTCTVTVRFAPITEDSFNDSFNIPSNDPDTPTVTITVTGTGTAVPVPNIVVTDSVNPDNDLQIPFGGVAQGSTSDQTVTIANTGTANLVIGSVANANPLAAPFSIAGDTCSGLTIAPSGTCTVTVRFEPSTISSFNDSFDIPSDDPDSSALTIVLNGMVPAANIVVTDSVNPDNDLQISFGSATEGNTVDQTVTVANTGTANLVIGNVASANPLAAPFSIAGDACSGETIAPSGTCTVTVRFAPITVNSFNDSFNIPSNDPDTATVTIAVTGTGTAVPVPNIVATDSVNPDNDLQIPFGSATEGNTVDQTLTVSNTGTANLVIGNVANANPLAAPFTIAGDACSGQSIAPSGTCAVTVRFAPTGNGSFSDSFDIPSNDPDTATVTIAVTGTGVGGSGAYQMGGAIQGNQLALANTATTIAGKSLIGWTDGTGSAARFRYPSGITTDGTNLYVADKQNHTIRQIVISTGDVTTLAGTAGSAGFSDGTGAAARFNGPRGITTDGTYLYVTENHKIRKIDISTGVVITLAGSTDSFGPLDGTGTAARFNLPQGITTDGANLYVADTSNHTIRQVVISTGVVTTLAGTGLSAGFVDGSGAAARFDQPYGITTVGTNLYVADMGNQAIRQIDISTGAVTTLAGGSFGSADGVGSAARFNLPFSITTDGTNLYVADTYNHTLRQIVISTAAVTTIAGAPGTSGSVDGTGSAARFNMPYGLAAAGTNLYVADNYNHNIRKIVVSTGAVTTFAGTAGSAGSADGVGAAARFSNPSGITTDGTNLYVADRINHTIRKMVISTGDVTTLAGTVGTYGTADGTGSAARFRYPSGITTDGTNLYVADRDNHTIRQINITTGAVTTLAGTAGSSGSWNGTGSAARFWSPSGITTDGANLYVADRYNHTIRKIVISTRVVTTFAGTAGSYGSVDGTGSAARFYRPSGITTDGTNLYVTEENNHTIRKIVISTGAVSTLAGTAGISGSADGTGPAARFYSPSDITTDGTNLYVADLFNNTIRRIVISTGVVTTLAGTAGSLGSADGTGSAARFYSPSGITTDGVSLYATDAGNNTIRRIQ